MKGVLRILLVYTQDTVSGCPLRLEKLESASFLRIWLEKLEKHRFFPALAGKAGIKNNLIKKQD